MNFNGNFLLEKTKYNNVSISLQTRSETLAENS